MQQPKGSDTQYLWVLDPIDGTKSFITGTQYQHGQHGTQHSGFALSVSFALTWSVHMCTSPATFHHGGRHVIDSMP